MKIHFGAFNCPIDGWVNTDITPHLFIARVPFLAWAIYKARGIPTSRYLDHQRGAFRRLRYLNVGNTWPFPDDSAQAIFSSHVVEHLTLRSIRICLKNAYRVLERGGVLRIVVPDLDALVARYRADSAFEWACEVFEAENASEKNMHHFMFNGSSLMCLLRESGFSNIHKVSYRVGICPDIDQLDNRPESLFMEAIK